MLKLKALIQVRRLMYLWHVLSRDEDELISRIYAAQTNCNNIGDWVRLMQPDKAELEITLTDEEIQGVKKKVTITHLKYLDWLKKKHLKAKYLDCTKLKQAD